MEPDNERATTPSHTYDTAPSYVAPLSCCTMLYWAETEDDRAFQGLQLILRSQLKQFYEQVNPRLMVDLLDLSISRLPVGLKKRNEQRSIQVGTYTFCDHPQHIFAGLVEVLYGLRSLLFHGELVPTTEMNDVYEPAYYILRRFLRAVS
jgi:hypothetical protein